MTLPEYNEATIFAVSDARGSTCKMVVRAALVQFPSAKCKIRKRPEITTVEKAQAVVEEAAALGAIIFYTLVCPDVRDAMRAHAEKHLVPVVDVIGPACSAMHDLFKSVPAYVPGLLYDSERDRFNMMDSIEFTLSHDDGRRPHELDKADAILVGVSRSGKSATSYYLAYHGVHVANVPLVANIAPPKQLLSVDPKKVVGLKINAMRLKSIREARVETMGTTLDEYTDRRAIGRELRDATDLMEKQGWHIVNVSYKAVEEVAKEVIKLCCLKDTPPRAKGG